MSGTLSAINARFSWKKVFTAAKISPSVINLSKDGNPWIFVSFCTFTLPNKLEVLIISWDVLINEGGGMENRKTMYLQI